MYNLVFENPASVKEMTNMRYGSMSSMVPTTSLESFGRFSQTYVVALSNSGYCFQNQDFFCQVVKSAHLTIAKEKSKQTKRQNERQAIMEVQVAIEVVGERGK